MNPTKLRIHTYGEPVLKKKAQPVSGVTDEIRQYLDAMVEVMRSNKGAGLAANQVGLDKRILVIEYEHTVYKLVNPDIIQKSGDIEFEEGCLSFPGLYFKVKRAEKLWVDFLDEQGRRRTIQTQGILSVIVQHEVDHLNGVLFIDRIPFPMKLKYFKQLQDLQKESKSHEHVQKPGK